MSDDSDDNQKALQSEKVDSGDKEQLLNLLDQFPPEILQASLIHRLESSRVGASISIQQIQQAQRFQGPIPPPEYLEGYAKVDKSIPDRVLKMAEKQQDHRHRLEDKSLQAEIDKGKTGQRSALLIVLLALLSSVGLGYSGHTVTAGIIFGGTVISLAGLFITGRHQKDSSPKDKNKETDK